MAEQNKAEKFVFYMYKMTKSYPPNKEVLKDISCRLPAAGTAT